MVSTDIGAIATVTGAFCCRHGLILSLSLALLSHHVGRGLAICDATNARVAASSRQRMVYAGHSVPQRTCAPASLQDTFYA